MLNERSLIFALTLALTQRTCVMLRFVETRAIAVVAAAAAEAAAAGKQIRDLSSRAEMSLFLNEILLQLLSRFFVSLKFEFGAIFSEANIVPRWSGEEHVY